MHSNSQKGGQINILQIAGEPVGGIRKHLHSLLLGLNKDIFKQGYVYSTVKTDKQFQTELTMLEEYLGNNIYPLVIKKRPDISDFINIWKLRKIVMENNINIIHGHGAKGGFYARILGYLCNVKVIYTPHGGSVHKMFSLFEDWLYTSVEKRLLKSTDCILFESKYAFDAFYSKVKRMPKKWLINYNGIAPLNLNDVAIQANNIRLKSSNKIEVNIGLFGMLRSLKGQIYAIQAIAELVKKGRHVALHLYGDGIDRIGLENYVMALGLQENVFFYGEVSSVELYIYKMDIIVIPSLFESFPYIALEVCALKKPIIASKVGGLSEIIVNDQTGILVEPGNSSILAEAIERYIDFPELAKEYSEKGYHRFIEQFTEDKMLSTITELYLDLKTNRITRN